MPRPGCPRRASKALETGVCEREGGGGPKHQRLRETQGVSCVTQPPVHGDIEHRNIRKPYRQLDVEGRAREVQTAWKNIAASKEGIKADRRKLQSHSDARTIALDARETDLKSAAEQLNARVTTAAPIVQLGTNCC